ncbi:hypothetical protein KGF57_004301 [Candida theae]|uniref:RSE1/DDB1/CPSF1 first beta-propeller domain-containing protein n=1 Tax=Candida theae TaxID=1198502 RepID=A0AAD5FWY4_9ASCO|nr:uncharacterized protein KGF57_004301 [Candida theae]KAI5950486.1 hypothetical protein KGF57_004301 [Candida theae]
MFLLTESSTNLRAITLALVVNVKGNRLLLLAQGRNISFYICEKTSVKFVTTVRFGNGIRSWAKFTWNTNNYVILIDSTYELMLIDLSGLTHKKHPKTKIVFAANLSSQGQRVSPNLEAPIILPVRESDPEFIILHVFYSNVQIITVKDMLESIGEDFVVPYTRSIGQIDVKQIINLSAIDDNETSEKPSGIYTFAVLYKDISSAYYIRYLDWTGATLKLSVSRQLSSFEEDPTLIQPCIQNPGGLIVYTSSSMFYFPPEKFQHMSVVRETKDVFVSTKTHDAHLIVTLDRPGRGKYKMEYRCFEPIDTQRTLLTTSIGKTFLLFMDIQVSTGNSLVVNQVRFIDLDYTTIPISNGLHRLYGNTFFQASKTSKSVLFEVLPTRPNINILNTIEGNPPVIDLKEVDDGDKFFACQGGWDGSQLRKYSAPLCKYTLNNEAKVSNFPLRVVGELGGKYLFCDQIDDNLNLNSAVQALSKDFSQSTINDDIENDVLRVARIKSHNITLTKNSLKVDGTSVFEGTVEFGTIQAEHGVVLVATTNNELRVFDFSQGVDGICCTLDHYTEGGDEISSADVYKYENMYWIICSLLSGKYEIWNVESGKNQVMYQGTSERAVFSSSILIERSNEPEQPLKVYAFLSFANGDFKQVHFKLLERELTLANEILETKYQMPIIWRRRNDFVVGFSSEGLVVPKMLKELDQFVFAKIERKSVVDVYLCGEAVGVTKQTNDKVENAIVTFANGAVELWEIDSGNGTQLTGFESVYSDKLFVKCLPMKSTKYIVVVAYDKLSFPGEVRTELILVDAETLAILDVFRFHDDTEVVDLCQVADDNLLLLGLNSGVAFICLPSNGRNPITIFKIMDDHIRLIEKSKISGYQSVEEMKFTSITDDEGRRWGTYLITGTINFFCSLSDVKSSRFEAQKQHLEVAPSLGLASTVGPDWFMIGDATAGVSTHMVGDRPTSGKRNFSITEEKYLTTMSHSSDNDKFDYHVIGYTSGNIVLLRTIGLTERSVKFTIDGDQVNSTTGSVNKGENASRIARIGTLAGGIFTLTKIENKNWIEVLCKCDEELTLYAQGQNLSILEIKRSMDDDVRSPLQQILDGRILFKFFGDGNPKLDSKFPNLVANKRSLQRIYYECCV